ncbi:hypothetical protein KY306_01555 [Candidatus Woesearchaeota archaeon]|nr:hypothetical protein [Candidatus Woesearchaeota archaeon]
MERTTAKQIMGKNFLGPEELKKISQKLGISDPLKKRIPVIPFSVQYLKKISKDYILVLGVSKDNKGKKLTINKMREIFGWNPQKAEPCFYNQDWYLKEKFAKDKILDFKWYLIRKTVDKKTYGTSPESIMKILKQ